MSSRALAANFLFHSIFASFSCVDAFASTIPSKRLIFFFPLPKWKMKSNRKNKHRTHTWEKWHISYKFYIWNNKMMLVLAIYLYWSVAHFFIPSSPEQSCSICKRMDWKWNKKKNTEKRIKPYIAAYLADQLDSISLCVFFPFVPWNGIFRKFNLQYWAWLKWNYVDML